MDQLIDAIRQKVTAPMVRRGVIRAGVFGSVARGEATESSDVDFLVEFESGRTLLDLSGLRRELGEILDREVDLATRASLHPEMREEVLRDLIPVL
jgi:predicted nucleotidyltransferase